MLLQLVLYCVGFVLLGDACYWIGVLNQAGARLKEIDMNKDLKTQLQHPDHMVRSRALLDLRDSDASLDVLIQALCTESDLLVREDLTWAIVRVGEAAVQPLIQLLDDPSAAVRHSAAHVLGKIKDARAVDALIGALNDDDAAVVLKAAFSLGQIGDEKAVPALVELVGHEHREVQFTLMRVLEDYGTPAVPLLIRTLNHAEWQVREQAADILGAIGDRDAVPALIQTLQDVHWAVRFAAVTALKELGGADAKNAIYAMLDDPEERVRVLAQKALKRMR